MQEIRRDSDTPAIANQGNVCRGVTVLLFLKLQALHVKEMYAGATAWFFLTLQTQYLKGADTVVPKWFSLSLWDKTVDPE
jgi:hypothetical protein